MVLTFVRGVLSGARPAQAVLLTLVTQMLVVVLNIVGGVITARFLGPTGRGVVAAVTLWPVFLSNMALLGLPSALVFHLRRESIDQDSVVTAGLLLALGAALLATLCGFVAVKSTMAQYEKHDMILAQFCVAATGIYLFVVVIRQIMVAYGRFRAFNTSSYLPPLLYVLVLSIASLQAPLTPDIAVMSLLLPSGFILSWMFHDLRTVWHPTLYGVVPWMRKLIKYAACAALGDIVTGILASLDRLVLVALLTPSLLGLYAVAYSLSRLLLILQTVTSSILFPHMAGDPQGAKQMHDFAFRMVIYLSIVAILGMAVFGRAMLTIMYGVEFGTASPILLVLMIEAGVSCASQVTSKLFMAMHHPGWVSAAQVISLVVAMLGMILLAPGSDMGSAIGAAIALLAASVARLTVLLPGIVWQLQLRLPKLFVFRDDVMFITSRW